ncbi:GNAT family N-acetyltransferase [uncultured Mesotoga sp.]|uniref:GNAT family N-acetyltransferase n=1 Tax=uncultured Mesotoga sp. TaxID=1184400 RepID=UPI002591FD90|nr:GNAT family N-acetyltransferase [uncultured Mesotoga sp.]
MRIREAVYEDAVGLRSLLLDIGWFSNSNIGGDEFPEKLKKMLAWNIQEPDHVLLVAEEDGDIVGYVGLHFIPYLFMGHPEGYISELFVKSSARGKGIGSKLLTEAVKRGRARGCSRMQLVNMKNRDSYKRGFYTKMGWRERENAADFVYDPTEG